MVENPPLPAPGIGPGPAPEYYPESHNGIRYRRESDGSVVIPTPSGPYRFPRWEEFWAYATHKPVAQTQTAPKKRRINVWGIGFAIFAGLVILGKMSGESTRTPPTSSPAALKQDAITPSNSEKALPLPVDQVRFIAIAKEHAASYQASPNDLAKGGVRNTRKVALCNALRSRQIEDWVGTIYKLSSNNEGKGVLTVQLSDDIYLKTWNNNFSDIGDQTLIDPNSSLFITLSSLKSGTAIKFSGSFIPSDTDCVREGSLTQSGSMTEPEFIMKFTKIEPL